MKVFEVITPTRAYYHGSRGSFRPGTILTRQTEGYVHGTGFDPVEQRWIQTTEQILEKLRPRRMRSRLQSVFLVDRPDRNLILAVGGSVDHIYQVEPLTPVEKASIDWYRDFYQEVMSLDSLEDDEWDWNRLRALSNGYWYASPGRRKLFEYRCGSARVLQELRP